MFSAVFLVRFERIITVCWNYTLCCVFREIGTPNSIIESVFLFSLQGWYLYVQGCLLSGASTWQHKLTHTHTRVRTHKHTNSCVWNLIPVWLVQICRHQGWWCWQTHDWAPLLFFIQAFATILFYALLSNDKLQKKLDLDYEINYVWVRVIFSHFFPFAVLS